MVITKIKKENKRLGEAFSVKAKVNQESQKMEMFPTQQYMKHIS